MVTKAPLSLTPTYTLGRPGDPGGALMLNATDSNSVDWVVGEELGWSDAAPVRLAVADRQDTDGGYSGPVWRNPRLISLKGVALCPDRITMLYAKERLRGVGDAGADPVELTIAEAHLTRYTMVKHATEARIRDINSSAFEWELSLRADDPLRYGYDQSVSMTLPIVPAGGLKFPLTFPFTYGAGLSGGTATAHNNGNANTYPVLTITGPLSAPAIANTTTGRQITAPTLTLSGGELLRIDMGLREFAVNGASRYDALSAASTWWPLQPGANNIRFNAASPDASPVLTVAWRSAWK